MNEKTKDLVWAALFLAIGIVIPYVFHVTSLPGQIFLPMHIPVLLCGVILGKKYGLILGILLPFVNSVLLGMPAIFPTGVFVFTAFLTTTFIKAIPGIIIQLILIPVVLKAVEHVKKGEAVINE